MSNNRSRHPFRWLLLAVVVVVFLLGRFSNLIVDWIWFRALDFELVFLRMLAIKLGLAAIGGIVAFMFLGVNLNIAVRRVSDSLQVENDDNQIEYYPGRKTTLPGFYLNWGGWLVAAVLTIPFIIFFSSEWDQVLRFIWGGSVGTPDPLYAKDIGFYLFRLPFWEMLQNSLTSLAFLGFAAVLALNLSAQYVRSGGDRVSYPERPATRHLVVLFVLFLCGYGWGFFLDRYELLYSTMGLVYGAGYTDQQIIRYGLWVMVVASSILALLVVGGYLGKRISLGLWGAGVYFVLMVVVLTAAPLVIQSFIVEPNELELETPFLEHEIAFTRQAYGIDDVQERSYPALSDLSRSTMSANQQTLDNIRLWDWRPLLQTFRQLQEIRLYYQFYEVDADRYYLNGDYRQVMLSARELARDLPQRADTWVNRTLQFTHGYGLAMSLASQEGDEGTPSFLVQDLPPTTAPGLDLEQAAIFYGERMPGYRIVNTGVQELDYPRGDENVYTSYQGHGGLLLDSFWKKLLYAWDFGDINIILSDYLNDESRIQIRRQIRQRVALLMPFLKLDSDPYLVLSEGRLFWIQDAYTVSDRYPYAEPYGGRLNYIRNSVKVVVDAYQGDVTFYAIEPDEPVLKAYRNAFPSMFQPIDRMPEDLRRHLRYPEDLLRIQIDKYNRYHMTIPQVFYNNEDLWTQPQEKYAGDPIGMEPYYILMRLPEEERLEFLLMLPLTPQNRDNMIAWIAARCDEPDYGKLLVYKLPKEKLILGPMQVEAMIDQDPVISRQLSLWDQRGSKVIRGNLLVIPIDHSFIYVEPVYLIAEGNNIPQLRRVIVAYDDRVVMEPTLNGAVSALFGAGDGKADEVSSAAMTPAMVPQLESARDKFQAAQQALQQGDWEAFGRAMGELQQYLEQQNNSQQ